MICPKCGANNPKDPLQCIRCGYIFPEYIAKHEIDMTRTSSRKSEDEKRVEAIKRFNAKQNGVRPSNNGLRPTAQRPQAPAAANGLKPGTKEYYSSVTRQVAMENKAKEQELEYSPMPTKIQKVHFIGRNGINRVDDIQECLITPLEFCGIVGVIYFIVIFFNIQIIP